MIKNWYNQDCDQYFYEYIKSGKVKVIWSLYQKTYLMNQNQAIIPL